MRVWLGLLVLTGATAVGAQMLPDAAKRANLAKAQTQQAQSQAGALEGQVRRALGEAERARAAQAALAGRIQLIEAEAEGARAQLALLRQRQRAQERRLAERQQPIVRLMAALQTMARRPPAAALVQPGSLADAVHVRAVLGTVTPQIAKQTAGLRAETEHARKLEQQAASLVRLLREKREQGQVEQQRLAAIEVSRRRNASALAATARAEIERADQLAARAATLEHLVRQLGYDTRIRDRLASLPGPLPRPARLSATLPSETVQAADARPVYRSPVFGPIIRGFGEVLPSGTRSRGVTVAARPGALVAAPGAGRISFAGVYRGYGGIAIIDHGGGYVSLITGLAAQIARTGDTVALGGPVGRAGPNGVAVELRKDGQALDLSQFVA